MEKAYLVTCNTNIQRILENKKISRLYVWDAECDHNFLYFLRQDFYQKDIFEYLKKLTIVTPCIFTEKNLCIFLKYLKENKKILQNEMIEFVVNDWGCFYLLKNMWFKNSIILWSHMYYQKRDPYSYKLSKELEETVDLNSLWNISIDFEHIHTFLKSKDIASFEIYNHTLLNQILHLDQNIHLYYPKVVMSITKSCYNYSIYNWEKALSTVESCSGCYNKKGSFVFNNFWIEGKYSWNKYSYDNFKLDLLNNSTLNLRRIIYNYDL